MFFLFIRKGSSLVSFNSKLISLHCLIIKGKFETGALQKRRNVIFPTISTIFLNTVGSFESFTL